MEYQVPLAQRALPISRPGGREMLPAYGVGSAADARRWVVWRHATRKNVMLGLVIDGSFELYGTYTPQ